MKTCPGSKPHNIKPHKTTIDRFYTNGHRICKDCEKIRNIGKNRGAYKKKYNDKRYTMYPKDLFCTYRHICPETKEIRYIGEGTVSRAYEFTARDLNHGKWFESILRKGYTPLDIVKVKRYNLTKQQARNLETMLVKLYGKERLFNK